MSDHIRYSVFYAPRSGSALAQFGAAWLGWDPEQERGVVHVDCSLDVAAMTQRPRKYGFHGTLKPPFRLADGTDIAGLRGAIQRLARTTAPFCVAPLRLARLGQFMALVPSTNSDALADLAASCVRELDAFRAPATTAELARRRSGNLTEQQDRHLVRWGYPYVMDQFRFHLTLTGMLTDAEAEATRSVLTTLTAPFCQDPLPVREICLFGERDSGAFHLIDRYCLSG